MLSLFLCIATVVAYSVPALAATETSSNSQAPATQEQTNQETSADKVATETKTDAENDSADADSKDAAKSGATDSNNEDTTNSDTSDNTSGGSTDTTEGSDDDETPSLPASGTDEEGNIAWSIDKYGRMTISPADGKDTAEMQDYDGDTAPWEKYKSQIVQLIIKDGITKIGKDTFNESCSKLEYIQIPSSVKTIAKFAFYKCTALEDIEIPESVEYIGYSAFGDCTSLKEVTIYNDNVEMIQKIFENVESNLTIYCNPNSAASNYAKYYGITRLCIDNKHTMKTEREVDNESSPFEEGHESLHCEYCDYKTDTVAYPKTATDGGTDKNITWTIDDLGLLTLRGEGNIYMFDHYDWENKGYKKYITKIIASKLDTVGFLQDCPNLKEVIIQDSTTDILIYAFEDCTSLEKVTLPESVTSIQGYAFHNCTALKEITIPAKSVEISSLEPFGGCSSDLVIRCNPDSNVKTYAEEQGITWRCINHTYGDFITDQEATAEKEGSRHRECSECHYVETQTIPKNTKSGTCGDNLTWTIDNDGLLTIFGTGAMEDYDGVTTSAPWIEAGYSSDIKSVKIEEGVTSISGCAFAYCTNLASVSLPSTLTSIGEAAFERCLGLTEITLPSSLVTIGKDAFNACSFKELTIPNSVKSIGEGAFESNTPLEEVTIRDNVSEIGENAFAYCNKLVIKCNSGSTAAKYAADNSITRYCIILHQYNEDEGYTVTTEATCEKPGSEYRQCTACDYKDVREIEATGHKWSEEYTVDKKATCTEPGSESKHCTACNKSNPDSVKTIDALGHTWKNYTQKAGYLKNGTSYSKCTLCGETKDVKTLAGYSKYIVKKLKVKKGKKSFKVSWSKASKANQKVISGYQIRYSKKFSMASSKYVKASKTSNGKTIKKLSKKTKYYVQVRNYMKKGGKTYYSKWSAKKTVKTK